MGKSKALQISVWNFPFADRAEGNGLDFMSHVWLWWICRSLGEYGGHDMHLWITLRTLSFVLTALKMLAPWHAEDGGARAFLQWHQHHANANSCYTLHLYRPSLSLSLSLFSNLLMNARHNLDWRQTFTAGSIVWMGGDRTAPSSLYPILPKF